MGDIKRPSNTGRPPKCCACGGVTYDGIKNEERKTICAVCEPLCAWCGKDAGGDLRDEGGARICKGCSTLEGPTQERWSAIEVNARQRAKATAAR